MPLKPPPSSAPRRARVIVAFAGAVTLAGFLHLTGDDFLTHAQLDRGIFVGGGKASPSRTLTHPWSGSDASGRAALKAPAEPDDHLVLNAYLAPLEQGGATGEGAADAGPTLVEADDASPQAAAAEAPPPAAALPAAIAPAPPRAPVAPPAAAAPPAPTPAPAPPAPPPAPQPVAAGLSALEQQIFDGQNTERGRYGLAPLRLDAGLTSVARRRAADMAARGYFAHTSPTGETAFSLIDAAGIPAPYAAENIGFNSYPEATSAASVLAAFLASPGHRANILSSRFTRVGVGVAVSASGIKYYAVVFAGP